jgi:hypothetical protein
MDDLEGSLKVTKKKTMCRAAEKDKPRVIRTRSLPHLDLDLQLPFYVCLELLRTSVQIMQRPPGSWSAVRREPSLIYASQPVVTSNPMTLGAFNHHSKTPPLQKPLLGQPTTMSVLAEVHPPPSSAQESSRSKPLLLPRSTPGEPPPQYISMPGENSK